MTMNIISKCNALLVENWSVLVVVAYGTLSLVMGILSKMLMSGLYFSYPMVVLTVQMAITLFLIEVFRVFGCLQLPPYTFERGRQLFWPSALYTLNGCFSLMALNGLNLAMYTAVKRCTPLVTLVFGVIVLKRPLPSKLIAAAVLLISAGAAIAAVNDAVLDHWAYLYGGVSVVCQALYLIQIEKASEDFQLFDIVYVNSFNCLAFLLVADFWRDEIRDAYIFTVTQWSSLFCALFIATILFGFVLNVSVFACTALTSAVTTAVVGNVKAGLQTFIGVFLSLTVTMDMTLNFWNLFGIALNLFGAFLYVYVKSKAVVTKPHS